MVKRVSAPAEHYLITNGNTLVTQFATETLSKFSLQKLLEYRLTNRNLKAGLDFSDVYKADRARERLFKMYLAYIRKEYAFLYKTGTTVYTFLDEYSYGGGRLTLRTFYDRAVSRYIRRVNRTLVEQRIPILIREYNTYNDVGTDMMEFYIERNGAHPSLNYYKLLFFTPQVLAFFKALVRKAHYTDLDARTLSRSKFSGWRGVQSSGRGSGRAGNTENSSNNTNNAAGTGRVTRQGTRAAS